MFKRFKTQSKLILKLRLKKMTKKQNISDRLKGNIENY